MRGSLLPAGAYVRRPSALHAARPGAAVAYCAALAAVPTAFDHPVLLVAALVAVGVATVGARVEREVARAARLAVPLALLVALVNPLVSTRGETLLVRGSTLLGHRFDITLEAVVYGGIAAGRVLVLFLAFALLSATVDPDGLLRAWRRVAPRSALTASLATRLVPVLVRDAGRMADAALTRSSPPGRGVVAMAAVRGSLERAVDVAAALEVRGYGSARRPARLPRAFNRHDLRLGSAAAGLLVMVVGARLAGVGEFTPYPAVRITLGPAEWALACATVALAWAPFSGRRSRLGVGT